MQVQVLSASTAESTSIFEQVQVQVLCPWKLQKVQVLCTCVLPLLRTYSLRFSFADKAEEIIFCVNINAHVIFLRSIQKKYYLISILLEKKMSVWRFEQRKTCAHLLSNATDCDDVFNSQIFQYKYYAFFSFSSLSLSLHYYPTPSPTTMRTGSVLNMLFVFFISMAAYAMLVQGLAKTPASVGKALAANASAIAAQQALNNSAIAAQDAATAVNANNTVAQLAAANPANVPLQQCAAQTAIATAAAVDAANQANATAQLLQEVPEPLVELPNATSGKGVHSPAPAAGR